MPLKVVDPPIQIIELDAIAEIVGIEFTVTSTVSVPTQPAADVPLKV